MMLVVPAVYPHDGSSTKEKVLFNKPILPRQHKSAHLLLNPDDVKGFPLELQLAHISPARGDPEFNSQRHATPEADERQRTETTVLATT